jgi:hypothetical protein
MPNGTSLLARNFARAYGALWLIANCVNTWKVFSAIVRIHDPMERLGYLGFGVILVILIFYSAFQVLALKPKIRRHIKILLAISFVPVVARGVIPSELAIWVLLALLPTLLLLHLFKTKTASAVRI